MTNASTDSGAIPGIILVAPVADSPLGPLVELLDVLRAAGYEVHQVSGEDDTIAAAEATPPDLILLALEQFDTAAMRLCHRLKKRPLTRQVAVAVIGQDKALARRLRAFEFGVVDYIDQALWVEEAAARIKAQVTTHRMQRRLRQQAQRAVSAGSATNLLADLQKALRRQAQLLQAQNLQLQQEMQEREQAQQALRLEQQKSEQLLLNILPRAVVDKLKQLEGSLAERFDDVTILFADIVNFTPLAAQISPLELVNWLNHIFSAFDRLAEQYQLEKIKTIGDAYMVVGGLPLPRSDHAEAIMEMALAMQEAAAHITRNDGQKFELRIGINTGPVVAGVIGIKKFSYDLWGDAVNIASRMESHGVPGKIQITEATYQHLKHRYTFEEVGQVMVKGHGYLTTYQYSGPEQKA
ncbi:adenylate/guanylate cyclase domain-containing protein [Phormidium tenue]|uniref:Adenylate cyclase n=1 Tax=Phormidium tenue NIES-30 TaxID=549789 RepID=A0A1U7J2G7_9CYAN|nr:adenylate/guanylate cyclase domain-containing protein [Phormidium tenue]MBD2231754.1 adenylate/guanylate cyclase domain-containing response regulator [Phormidium tenue FACHB-1052]OKH46327.1 adenylate/guanylate cyclase domain-containing response regulator [Phormidium tenue NIES-30]